VNYHRIAPEEQVRRAQAAVDGQLPRTWGQRYPDDRRSDYERMHSRLASVHRRVKTINPAADAAQPGEA
jgi:hypothetical protein